MFFKSTRMFLERLEYRKTRNGSWKAEFRGGINIDAEARTLEECRHRAFDALDEKLFALLEPADSAKRKPAKRGSH